MRKNGGDSVHGKAVKAINEVLGALGLLKHPDKTFIGRTERGFDFLGYHFGPDGLSVAKKTVENFVARAIRLYEQEPEGAVKPLPVWIVCAAGGRPDFLARAEGRFICGKVNGAR